MAFPLSHKTVFVLDQGPNFAQPCERIEIEAVKSSANQHAGFIPMPHIEKSIWTSATESLLGMISHCGKTKNLLSRKIFSVKSTL